MARFTIQLDKRRKLHNGLCNLVVRVNVGNDMVYLNIAKLTEQQYDHVFNKKAGDEESIAFREKCEKYRTKCERIFNEVKPFNKERFRTLLKEEDKELPKSLFLKDLFTDYYTNNENLKNFTRTRYRTSMNVFEAFQPGVTVFDVTPEFLRRFENNKRKKGLSGATVASYITDLKRILNYYTKVKEIIPKSFKYPFSEIGYRIKNVVPGKFVLSNKEIMSIVAMEDFDTPEQEFARDVWLFLYRCNGSNFADLLRLKWTDMNNEQIIFYRKKTETTRKKNVKPIIVPRNVGLNELLQRIGDNNSIYVLGLLKEGYSETTFDNKSNKTRGQLNKQLKEITGKLNLTSPLRLSKARECYATTLFRAGKSVDKICDMMGQSTVTVTKNHYVGSMDANEIFEMNDVLF